MDETWNGIYEYKGFSIWSPSEKEWIIEPNWKIEAIENYKSSKDFLYFSTINKAKAWINKNKDTLKEENYL